LRASTNSFTSSVIEINFSRRGLKGGFYHDGRFTTLLDVVNHYDGCFNLQLSDDEKSDLVQYLLTL
jgi:hypothetical protein